MSRAVVNGVEHEVGDAGDAHLLDWLRDTLGLTGTKYGCGETACGACSVLIDGRLARACTVPMADVAGKSVTTIEGLSSGAVLHPVQQALLEVGAIQCGFCTPGMVMAAVALLDANPHPSDADIVEWMSPNVCRCCAYPRIGAAIRRAADAATALAPTAGEPASELSAAPHAGAPWDLSVLEGRDYFEVLGDGLMVVVPPPPDGGGWNPTGGAWLHVDAAGIVTAFTGKVEVGQGTRRALRMIVAEEMEIPLDTVRLVMGDTDLCPFDIGTFGSLSMATAATDLQRAAAAARDALAHGEEIAPGTRRVEVVAGVPRVTPPDRWHVAGHRTASGDVAAVTGAKRFTSDLRRPGMQHARLLRPPAFGAHLRAADVSAARALPGVTVLVDGDFIGVVAPTPVAADVALAAVRARWDLDAGVDEAGLEGHLRAHPVEGDGWSGAYAHDAGDFDSAITSAEVRVDATYTTAYVAHAPLETRVALAEWDAGRLTVWTGTQQPFNMRRALADALEVTEAMVRVVVPDTGGGFGGKHDPEVAIATARLARAAGTPVRLRWTREEEFTWAYFRPAAVIDVTAGASADGLVNAWEFIAINGGSAAIATPYAIPHQRLRFQPADSPLHQGSYRGLAATANTFARESCMDEIAATLGVDPLQFRLRHLEDDRLAEVLTAAADRFGWADQPDESGRGFGLAAGIEKGGRVATCVEVRVRDADLEVVRVVTAFECGAVIDPDNLRNQIEGATIMGLGGALFEVVHFAGGRILNPRFSEYRVPRFSDIPPIDVVLVDRPDLPPAGAGETPLIAIAPALANAVNSATGCRIRSLPLLDDPMFADHTEPAP